MSAPGALYRFRRQQQTGDRLALIPLTGTLPGILAIAIAAQFLRSGLS